MVTIACISKAKLIDITLKKNDTIDINSNMPKKMVVKNVDSVDNSEQSYDAIKEEVVESVPEVVTVESAVVPSDVPTVEPSTDEGFKTVKPKKSAEIVTCPHCGKSMTAKSLKYTHCVICPKRPGIETINCAGDVNDVPDQAPPMPKLQRSVTVVEDHEPVTPKKTKAKPRAKKSTVVEEAETPTLPEPTKRRSRAVERAMKYESMVANAL